MTCLVILFIMSPLESGSFLLSIPFTAWLQVPLQGLHSSYVLGPTLCWLWMAGHHLKPELPHSLYWISPDLQSNNTIFRSTLDINIHLDSYLSLCALFVWLGHKGLTFTTSGICIFFFNNPKYTLFFHCCISSPEPLYSLTSYHWCSCTVECRKQTSYTTHIIICTTFLLRYLHHRMWHTFSHDTSRTWIRTFLCGGIYFIFCPHLQTKGGKNLSASRQTLFIQWRNSPRWDTSPSLINT